MVCVAQERGTQAYDIMVCVAQERGTQAYDVMVCVVQERGTQAYDVVVVGHSLGAGTAAILSILLRREYPTIHCYAFAPPGGLLRYQTALAALGAYSL